MCQSVSYYFLPWEPLLKENADLDHWRTRSCLSVLPIVGLVAYYFNLKAIPHSSINVQPTLIERHVKNCVMSGITAIVAGLALIVIAGMHMAGTIMVGVGIFSAVIAWHHKRTDHDIFGFFTG